jgi:ribosomal protein L3 glutamine methyltransferase
MRICKMASEIATDLVTVRDFFRYAMSRFRAAHLIFGHGTTTELDEAAFLILEALHLPIDDINPYLDARLLMSERKLLAELIEARVTQRIPAAYLLKKAYVGGVPFYVDERVIIPRSFIAELLRGDLFNGTEGGLIEEPHQISHVLDLCTGSGCLAILAAYAFPQAYIDAIDISAEALAVAKHNVQEAGLADRITLHRGDLFAPITSEGPKPRYDLIITNPPYVDAQVMSQLPPEYRHEPSLALAGGTDGLDIVRRILDQAPDYLSPQGGLICEIGEDRDIVEQDYPNLPFLWLDTEASQGEVFWLPRQAFEK